MIKSQFCVFGSRPQIKAMWYKGLKKYKNSCLLQPNANRKDLKTLQNP